MRNLVWYIFELYLGYRFGFGELYFAHLFPSEISSHLQPDNDLHGEERPSTSAACLSQR